MADEKQTKSPSEDAAEDKEKRPRRPKLEATPLGMRLPKAPPVEAGGTSIRGSVRIGWLRQFTASVPRTIPDDAVVVFSETQTEVRP